MYTLKDREIIEEIENGDNFGYILQEDKYFVGTDYKVLSNQKSDIFVPCVRIRRNGKIELYYMVDDYTPLSAMLAGMTPDMLINIAVNMFESVSEVKNNGFLACQNIDLSIDKIFVEPSTLKVKLVYVPVSVKAFGSYGEFENELRSGMVKLIDRELTSTNDRVEQFRSDLCNGSMTLEDVYRKSGGAGGPSAMETMPPVHIPVQQTAGTAIKLVAMNAPQYFEIVVDRDETLIGKKQELVDAVIPFNNMISRRHCKIVRLNGGFYISDEGSANGTFVNQMRLNPGQRFRISRGDIIRLANSDFQIV